MADSLFPNSRRFAASWIPKAVAMSSWVKGLQQHQEK